MDMQTKPGETAPVKVETAEELEALAKQGGRLAPYERFFLTSRTVVQSICCVLLALQVLIVFYVVIGRYVFNKTPGWGEESALLCMVWFCLLSSALPILDDTHLRMNVIEYLVPNSVVRVLDMIGLVLTFCFGMFLIIEGFKMTQLAMLNTMPGLRIKSAWLFASAPVAGLAICIGTIEKVVLVWKARQ